MIRTAFLIALLSAPAIAQETPETGDSFHEIFRGISSKMWIVSDGWSNGAHQNCTWSKQAVGLSYGQLQLRFLDDPERDREYLCGEVQSVNRYGYGTFEARVRTGRGSGLNAAFFTYIGPAQESPHDEIDFEILLRDTSSVSLNSYVSGEDHNGAEVQIPGRTSEEFHTYSMIWEPRKIRWYVDGHLLHTAHGPVPSHPQKILFSLWGSDTLSEWMGNFVRPSAPVTMEVDWVAYTKLGERCQFDGSILCVLQR